MSPQRYAKLYPRFWTGQTGRAIRNLPRSRRDAARILASYLIHCPFANAIGLYYLPLGVIADETGLSTARVTTALDDLASKPIDFANYDLATETIFVHNQALYQLGPTLEHADNRRTFILRELATYAHSPFIPHFLARYGAAYHLSLAQLEGPHQAPSQGPYQAPSLSTGSPLSPLTDPARPRTEEFSSPCTRIQTAKTSTSSRRKSVNSVDNSNAEKTKRHAAPLPKLIYANDTWHLQTPNGPIPIGDPQ